MLLLLLCEQFAREILLCSHDLMRRRRVLRLSRTAWVALLMMMEEFFLIQLCVS